MNDSSHVLLPRRLLAATAVGARERVHIVVARGAVTGASTRHAVEPGVLLLMFRVHRLSALARMVMGSRNGDLLQHLPCDTLLMRAAESGGDG